ncbi:hypothetical protein Q0N71_31300 [Bacillus thuringiensis]|uniref:hypothetical protein n=1 Tax=Bacillus thuringiensis TaxID=1428 RepID=UPI00345A936F
MLHKKKIACASLLSLGILAGGSFVGNTTASAASTTTKVSQADTDYQDLKDFGIFNNFQKIDWNKEENIKKLSNSIVSNEYAYDSYEYAIYFPTLLKQFNIKPEIIDIFNTLSVQQKKNLLGATFVDGYKWWFDSGKIWGSNIKNVDFDNLSKGSYWKLGRY